MDVPDVSKFGAIPAPDPAVSSAMADVGKLRWTNQLRRVMRSKRFWLAANALSLLALSLILFRLQAPVTYYRYDGTLNLSIVKNQSEWMTGFGTLTMDFLKGIGGMWAPVNTRMIPGFIVGLIGGDGEWLAALSATWFAAEFAVATILIGRTLDFPLPGAVLGAWLGLFGGLPYIVPVPAFERIWGNPNVLSTISFVMLALALFLAIGRGSRARSIGCIAALLLILIYLTLFTPLYTTLFLPVLGFFGAVGLTMANDRRELRWKLAAALGIVPIYFVLFGAWLAGLFLYAKTTFFWSELYSPTIRWNWASLLVEDPAHRPAGVVLLLLAVLGGVLTTMDRRKPLRRFAIGYLAFVALLWSVTGLLILTEYPWPGPTVSYLDWMIYPLHALFAAYCVYWCLLRIASGARWQAAIPTLVMAAGVLLPWTALAVWVPPYDKPMYKNMVPFRWPPLRTSLVDFLEREIGLRPGQPFRGRVVNLAGSRFGQGAYPEYAHIPFINQHNYDAMVAFLVGNDHRGYGFWFYDIPTLDDDNHMASPFFHFLISRLLMPSGMQYMRPHETATVFNAKILAQLGVRYVLTEEPLTGRAPVLSIELQPGRNQYLYELDNANVSGHGVIRVTTARTATEAMERMSAPDYDPEKEAVLFDDLPAGPLVPVARSHLNVSPGFLTVSAEAAGRALLVLPVEYSRCLEFTWLDAGNDSPRIVRADLDETAILFTDRLQVRIAFRTGPIENATCRLRDLRDAEHVKLGALQ